MELRYKKPIIFELGNVSELTAGGRSSEKEIFDERGVMIFDVADVCNHIDLVCSVCDGVASFGAFDCRGAVAEREADNGAKVELALGVVAGESNV